MFRIDNHNKTAKQGWGAEASGSGVGPEYLGSGSEFFKYLYFVKITNMGNLEQKSTKMVNQKGI